MDGDSGGMVATPTTGGGRSGVRPGRDVHARRTEIVARLLERGMSIRVLHTLLPGWDDAIRTAGPSASRLTDAAGTAEDGA